MVTDNPQVPKKPCEKVVGSSKRNRVMAIMLVFAVEVMSAYKQHVGRTDYEIDQFAMKWQVSEIYKT